MTEMMNNGEIIKMVHPLLDPIQFLHMNTIGGRKKFKTTVKKYQLAHLFMVLPG